MSLSATVITGALAAKVALDTDSPMSEFWFAAAATMVFATVFAFGLRVLL